jgi:tetratricopeptide (TPR) repeat protein
MLRERLKVQTEHIKQLKKNGASADEIAAAKALLRELKNSPAAVAGEVMGQMDCSSESAQGAIDELKSCCQERPRDVSLRVELGLAYEESGDLRAALGEMRCAVSIKPTYRKAVEAAQRLESLFAGSKETIFSSIAVPEMVTAGEGGGKKSGLLRSQAILHLSNGDFEQARQLLTTCIKSETEDGGVSSSASALFASRAEAHLGLQKFVAAASDSMRATQIDPTNYRAHLIRGRALARLLLGKPASSANAERGDQARCAFAAALQDENMTVAERAAVAAEADQFSGQLTQLNPACAQQ